MLLIQNAYLINPADSREGICDIAIGNGKFLAIEASIPPEQAAALGAGLPGDGEIRIIDARGLTAAPGLIDTHSHFRDPGFTRKEDLQTGAAAAARGGYTSVILMANVKPAVDCPDAVRDILERGRKTPVHIYTCANVTRGMQGRELADLKALAEAGAAGFTDDGLPVLNAGLLRAALKTAGPLGLPVSLHEEDPAYIRQPGVNGGGKAAAFLGLEGAGRAAEYTMIERDLQIAIHPGIHAEATPHHFSLTEEAVIRKGTLAKVNPPIRTEEDRRAIIDAIVDGTIDIIATDHAPHCADEKDRPFTKAPSGMIGLETALSLGIRELVRPGYITMRHLLALLTCNPAAFYHLPAGSVETGAPADLVLFDPEETWTVTGQFASKSSNSPFIGETMPGVVRYTICGGQIVYQAD